MHDLTNYDNQGRLCELESWIAEREKQEATLEGALKRVQTDLSLYRKALGLLMSDPDWAPEKRPGVTRNWA